MKKLMLASAISLLFTFLLTFANAGSLPPGPTPAPTPTPTPTPAPTPVVIPFSPLDIAGIRVWLDFSDETAITKDANNVVAVIKDKSANGFTFAAGAGSPNYVANGLNGKSVLRFDGVSSMLSGEAGEDLRQVTLFIVAQPNSDRRYNCLISSPNQATGQLSLDVGNQTSIDVYVTGGNSIADTGRNSFPIGTWKRITWTYDVFGNNNGGPNNLFLNNLFANAASVTGSIIKTTPLSVGYDNGLGFHAFDGQIAEVIVYDNVLSVTDRNLVDRYLQVKWGFAR